MKKLICLLTCLLSMSNYAKIKKGVYEGSDMRTGEKCLMEVLQIDHQYLRSSRINRTVQIMHAGLPFQLHYNESFDFDRNELIFEPRYMEDVIQIGMRLYPARLYMNEKDNYNTPFAIEHINGMGDRQRCEYLTYISPGIIKHRSK